MPTVYDLTLEQLTDRLVAWGEPAFRAKQVWSQLWKRAATYDRMSDVSPALRERLAAELPLGVEVLDERTADRGATRKALLRLGGEHAIETVLMGYRDRVTVCVSSQSGCAMGCTFCATGQMGLRNNLTAGEIAAQVVWARREAAHLPDSTPQRLSNVVFMGMGEPLANERHVFASIARLTDPRAFGLGARHVTVSDGRARARHQEAHDRASAGRARGELPCGHRRGAVAARAAQRPLSARGARGSDGGVAIGDAPAPLDRVGDDRPGERHRGTGGRARADRAPARRAREPDPAEPDAGLSGGGVGAGAHPPVRRGARAREGQRDRA